jgi:membrane-bound serine protease (ClpP class)
MENDEQKSNFWQIGLAAVTLLISLIQIFLNASTHTIEYWELGTLVSGIFLFLMELFFVPGFGFIGILGLALMFLGSFLLQIPNQGFDFSLVAPSTWATALAASILGWLSTTGGILYLLPKFLRNSRLSLNTSMSKELGYLANKSEEDLTGKTGIAFTVLRPSGKIKIEDGVYDAATMGEFIEPETAIYVLGKEGSTWKVRKL